VAVAEAAVRSFETWPHVTEILRDAGLVSTEWMTDEDRDRGTAVHLAIKYLLEGTLDRSSLDPTVAPRLAQFERFMVEVKPVVHAVEERVFHPLYLYQGTLDLRVTINGRRGVVDVKGTTPSEFHGPQLAAYLEASGFAYERSPRRHNLYLHPDRYRLIERANAYDWKAFLAALSLKNWRLSCKTS
jgi:hypothetical protein